MVLTEKQTQEKIKQYAPLIQKYDSPISIATRLAQLILESQLFTSELAIKSNNGFGIKVSKPWTGEGTEHLSGEVGGARVSEFRKYPTHEASIKDHAGFFTSTDFRATDAVYGLAIKADNYKDEAMNLGPKFPGDKNSYAGDPKYGPKLIEIIERYNLTQYDTKKESVKMPTVLLIAGHGLNTANGYFDPGARGYVQKGEHRWYTEDVFPAMRKYLPKGADVIFHTAYNVYSRGNIVALAKSYGSDTIVIECHFDSGGTAYSKPGGHVIIYKDFSADALDLRLRDAIQETVGLHPHYNAGISKRDNLQNVNLAARGGINYRLIEWGMSSDKGNGAYMVNNVDTIAKAFVKAIFNEVNSDAPKPKPVETKDPHNPQGLKESVPSAYVAPRLPFKQLKVGDKATILSDKNGAGNYIWQWYNPTTNKLMVSGKQAELAGNVDKIKKIKKIDRIQHSEYMYLLEGTNSWILEEYLKEPRDGWDQVDEDLEEPSEDVGTFDGDYVQLHGKRYKVGDEIK